MSLESVMLSNHLILCHLLLLLPSIFPSIRIFSKESVLCIKWPKYWSFNFASVLPKNSIKTLKKMVYVKKKRGLFILESPLDCKEIKPVNPKGNQPWIFIGRTDAEAEAPIHGYLMWSIDSLEKTLTLGKIEGRRRSVNRGRDGWMASPTQRT